MITHKQLLRHKFIPVEGGNPQSPLYLRGDVNGVLSGGVFHFVAKKNWHQAKNINHLKHLYINQTGKALDRLTDVEWFIVNGVVN